MERTTDIANPKDGSQLMLIPEGEFLMGSDVGYPSERPAHRVFVSPFYIARTLVTNSQYRSFVLETGYAAPYMDDPRAEWANWDRDSKNFPAGRETHPVVLTSWIDASAYCEWAGTRLATEAEWEKAARGRLDGKLFPWGDEEISHELANYDNQDGTTPVGVYPPNGYGLYDMVGNAWEWVADYYDPKYYSRSPMRDPRGPEQGSSRVLRGGSWLLFARYCRVSYRFRNSPNFHASLIGFRVARSL
jgi:formylglycine-generating enzyme required for sulfatase activity